MAINVNNHKNMIKVLFIHNSIPEYRLRFMVQLSMCCDVKYLTEVSQVNIYQLACL